MPGIMPRRRCTEPLRQQIAKDHHSGICGSVLAGIFKLGSATIERIYAEYNRRKAAERESLQCPIILGIDEHTLHKKQRFATTFCDLKNHRVFDVVPGKSAKDLEPFLARLKGRERVKVVCIDLSSTYRSIIRKWFPNARIVADRFHVVRVIQRHFITLCREIMGEDADKRKASALLRTNPKNLDAARRLRLAELFLQFPALKPLYKEMHHLRKLICIKSRTKRQCLPLAKALHRSIKRLKQSRFKPLETLAKTLRTWIEPIACMWRFTKNNGITEGFHRKMKLIQRRAYGFKNFQNYRLRVIAQCG
jgi:transposase